MHYDGVGPMEGRYEEYHWNWMHMQLHWIPFSVIHVLQSIAVKPSFEKFVFGGQT